MYVHKCIWHKWPLVNLSTVPASIWNIAILLTQTRTTHCINPISLNPPQSLCKPVLKTHGSQHSHSNDSDSLVPIFCYFSHFCEQNNSWKQVKGGNFIWAWCFSPSSWGQHGSILSSGNKWRRSCPQRSSQLAESGWNLVLGITCKCLFLPARPHPYEGSQLLQIVLPAREQIFKT